MHGHLGYQRRAMGLQDRTFSFARHGEARHIRRTLAPIIVIRHTLAPKAKQVFERFHWAADPALSRTVPYPTTQPTGSQPHGRRFLRVARRLLGLPRALRRARR